jgi:hypothetical protein
MKTQPGITTDDIRNNLRYGRSRTGKYNMPYIGTGFHFLIANKINSFLGWLEKLRRDLAM